MEMTTTTTKLTHHIKAMDMDIHITDFFGVNFVLTIVS